MQFKNLLAAFAFTSLAAAGRGCNSGGESWGDQQRKALELAKKACNSNDLSGHYDQGQVGEACYNMGSNKKVNFEIVRTDSSPWDMPASACFKHMEEQIKDCKYGGRGVWPGWEIRADPNRNANCGQ